MKPPFSYYGGKQRLTPKLIPLIPKHTVYVEPFAGSAALLFAKPWPQVTNTDHYREVINDINSHVYNFYLQLRERGPELCEKLALTLHSREEHNISKYLACEDKLEAARRFFINISTSYSNLLSSGFRSGVSSENISSTWVRRVDRLPNFINRIRGVLIENLEANDLISKFDSPQSFFYVDPPYVGFEQGHYKGYTIDDFRKLVETLSKIQGSFMLSTYLVPGVEIPHDWEKFEFRTHCSSSSAGKSGPNRNKSVAATKEQLGNRERTEIVYRKISKVPIRPELQKLYDAGKFDCFTGNDSQSELF